MQGQHTNKAKEDTMSPVDRSELGLYIKEARERKTWSVRATADKMGVNASILSRLERGEQYPAYTPRLLSQIADALELDERYLYALAGLEVTRDLPELAPYLKAKYNLPQGAIDDMENHLRVLKTPYETKPKNRNRKDG